MKKIFVMMMTTIIAVMSISTISSAATKSDIVTLLRNSHVLEVYVAQAESYLNSITVTSAQADAVIEHINNANAIVGTKTLLSELTSVQKAGILAEISAAAVHLNLTVTISSGSLIVKDASMNVVYSVNLSSSDLIKQTGFDYSIILFGMAFLMLAGVAGIVVGTRLKMGRKSEPG
ncbi:MAG: hypothetical protein ACYCYI_07410 [Saccharofermentanales bacterium]